jgi:uncharacterized membrane protein
VAHVDTGPAWAAKGPLAIHAPTMDDPWRWLGRGWTDLWRQPLLSLGYGATFVVIGLLITAGLRYAGLESMAPALAAGFTLLGPVLAIGLYEMSRRYETGESVSLNEVFAPHLPSPPQFAFLSFVLMFLFLLWMRLATLNYALFTHGDYTPLAQFVSFALETEQGLTMIVVGTLVGGALAAFVYAISVISVPLLLRHDVDVLTAIWISFQTVIHHPGPMLLWAWLIAVLTAIGFATMFIGLIVVFPLIGHATWHAYRTIVTGERLGP